jgi:hypothetical protein
MFVRDVASSEMLRDRFVNGAGSAAHFGPIQCAWRVAMDDRRLVVSIQRGGHTWFEVTDFDLDVAMAEEDEDDPMSMLDDMMTDNDDMLSHSGVSPVTTNTADQ